MTAAPALADRDPYGDATLAYHPAIGYTQSLRRLRALGDGLPLAEWRRAFLNLPTAGDDKAAFDVAMWTARAIPEDDPAAQHRRPGDTVIAYDASRDGTGATIAAAWAAATARPTFLTTDHVCLVSWRRCEKVIRVGCHTCHALVLTRSPASRAWPISH